jgi:hypothetical protein
VSPAAAGEPLGAVALAGVVTRVARPAGASGTRVLAVDGRSGAGKTTLATALAASLGGGGAAAPVVSLEDAYPGWDGLDAAVPLLVGGVLEPLAGGAAAELPGWDWARGVPTPPRPVLPSGAPQGPPPWVVVEGVGVGARVCAPHLAVLLWLEVAADVRHERAMARDGDLYRPHWRRWAAQEDRHLDRERTPHRADLVLGQGRAPETWSILRVGPG